MTRGRLAGLAREWMAPGLGGLAGAGLVIAGAEIGGVIGWMLLGLVACAMVGVVGWIVWTAYRDDPFYGPDDEAPPEA